jgi:MFS family permease
MRDAGLARRSDGSGAGRRFGGLLGRRDFRLLWIGETISQLGNAMAVVAMPLLAITVLHASTFTVGALVAAGYLPWLIIGLPAGAWVDRLPARAVMITCDATATVLYASVPVAAWLGVLTVGQLLVVAPLAGTASVLFGTAYQVYLPSLISTGELVEGNAKLQGSASAAALGGPGLAGLVAQVLGAAVALLFNAASFLVSAGCLLGIRAAERRTDPRVAGPALDVHPPAGRTGSLTAGLGLGRNIAQGARFVASDRYLRPMSIFGMIGNVGLTGNQALVVVFLVRDIHLHPIAVGLLMAIPGLSGVLGAIAASRVGRRLGTARGLLLVAVCALPCGLLIPLAEPGARLAFFAVGVLITASGIAVANVLIASFRQAYSPPGMRGRVTATMGFLTAGTSPLGALLGGALGTALGARDALWIMFGIVAISGTPLLARAFTASRDLPIQPPTAVRVA